MNMERAELDAATLDPNKQYVKINTWGTMLIPLELITLLENIAVVDSDYADGKSFLKLRKDNTLSFSLVPKEEVTAAIAAHKLEG